MSHNLAVNAYEEKRDSFRINTVLPMTFRLEGEAAQPLPKPTPINLSLGGAGFLTERSLAPGDSLSLAIFLPSGPPILAQAKVVRSVPFDDPQTEPTYMTGLQFLTLDQRNRERLNKYIFTLQVERRRTRCEV